MSDFKLDGITLDRLMEKTFCGKCNNSKDKEKDMIEGTKLKTFKEIYYSGGTTKTYCCPKCGNEIKICIPNDEGFWELLDDYIE